MNEHQKVSWNVCSVLGAIAALSYLIVSISILCINIAGLLGMTIPQFGLQYADFWAYFPRIILSVAISVCYGLRWGIEKVAKEPNKISFRLMVIGIFALICMFLELA